MFLIKIGSSDNYIEIIASRVPAKYNPKYYGWQSEERYSNGAFYGDWQVFEVIPLFY